MIKITLKDGSNLEVEKGTSILEVAKKISEGLARVATCGEVNGEIKGLDIEETLSHKRKTDFGIYEDAMKLR